MKMTSESDGQRNRRIRKEREREREKERIIGSKLFKKLSFHVQF